MASDAEKLPLIEPTAASNDIAVERAQQLQRARDRTRRVWALLTITLLLTWTYKGYLIAHYQHYRPHGEHHHSSGAIRADQCTQVDPIFPSQGLTKMDDYLTTPSFRNLTIRTLSGAVQVPTESYDDLGAIGEDVRWDAMYKFAAYLQQTYPLIHSHLKVEKVNTHGLLYTWQGSDASLKPTVLMAHQDVVPVAEATVKQWTYPPYSGHYDGKYIWGRGASDCKTILIGIMNAVETLIEAGFEPTRSLVLSYGFDEESSGRQGAGHLSSFLLERYGKDGAAVIVDEGAGLSRQWGTIFATPGVAEKGYIDALITVRMPGGHSSVPPKHNGIGVISELITQIEAEPYAPRLADENPYLGLLQCGAQHAPNFPKSLRKALKAHRPCKKHSKKEDKLALEVAKQSDFVKYLFTTSSAVDVINGGVKANALPERTTALVNHRVNVGDTTKVVEEKLTRLANRIAAKYNLTVSAFDEDAEEVPLSITIKTPGTTLEPAPVTPTSVDVNTAYSILSGTTRAVYGKDVIVAPGLMTGNTDTRYYWDLSKNIFRYGPTFDPEGSVDDSDMMKLNIHTVNEKSNVAAVVKGSQWFSIFIRNMDEADLS